MSTRRRCEGVASASGVLPMAVVQNNNQNRCQRTDRASRAHEIEPEEHPRPLPLDRDLRRTDECLGRRLREHAKRRLAQRDDPAPRSIALRLAPRHQFRDASIEHIEWALDADRLAGSPSGRLFADSLGLALAMHLLGHSAATARREEWLTIAPCKLKTQAS